MCYTSFKNYYAECMREDRLMSFRYLVAFVGAKFRVQREFISATVARDVWSINPQGLSNGAIKTFLQQFKNAVCKLEIHDKPSDHLVFLHISIQFLKLYSFESPNEKN